MFKYKSPKVFNSVILKDDPLDNRTHTGNWLNQGKNALKLLRLP